MAFDPAEIVTIADWGDGFIDHYPYVHAARLPMYETVPTQQVPDQPKDLSDFKMDPTIWGMYTRGDEDTLSQQRSATIQRVARDINYIHRLVARSPEVARKIITEQVDDIEFRLLALTNAIHRRRTQPEDIDLLVYEESLPPHDSVAQDHYQVIYSTAKVWAKENNVLFTSQI